MLLYLVCKLKELIKQLPLYTTGPVDFVVDTCFLYYLFEHQHEKAFAETCEEYVVVLTSFNAEEFLFHSHDVGHRVRERFRHAVKHGLRLFFHEISISPGNPEGEKKFVTDYDEQILKLVPDPSDAVLLVAALQLKADVLTRDKHHLFTTKLENYVYDKGLQVLNNLP